MDERHANREVLPLDIAAAERMRAGRPRLPTTTAAITLNALLGHTAERPAMQVGVKDVIAFSCARLSPTRRSDLAVGNLPGSSNGLHGSRCGNERSRACLLPHDEESVRADGDAGVARLLPEGSAERS